MLGAEMMAGRRASRGVSPNMKEKDQSERETLLISTIEID